MADDNNGFLTEIYIILLIIASGGLLIALYHCVSMLSWDLHHRRRQRGQTELQLRANDVSYDNSMAGLIPSHKHKKVTGLEHDEDEPMCAVCLSDFEEGDELRTLPECMHSFHVPCIDMWLYSHRSCPICRIDATSTVATPTVEIVYVVDQPPQEDQEVRRPEYSDVLPDLAVQSRDLGR